MRSAQHAWQNSNKSAEPSAGHDTQTQLGQDNPLDTAAWAEGQRGGLGQGEFYDSALFRMRFRWTSV